MKALGIIAMIFSISAIFIPVVGPHLTIICALLAAFSAGPGLTFGIVSIGVNIVNIFFLSPSLWLIGMLTVRNTSEAPSFQIGVIYIGVQIVAGIVLVILHSILKKKKSVEIAAVTS